MAASCVMGAGVLVVSYQVAVTETINGKEHPTGKAPRLSVFHQNGVWRLELRDQQVRRPPTQSCRLALHQREVKVTGQCADDVGSVHRDLTGFLTGCR
jgi:hypothetical protein